IPRPPLSPLFPYTTLFRSVAGIAPHVAAIQVPVRFEGRHSGLDRKVDRLLIEGEGARRVAIERPKRESELGEGPALASFRARLRSEEHTSELQSRSDLVCR